MAEPSTRRASLAAHNDNGTQAILEGRPAEAAGHFEAAVRELTPADDDLAADLYENLGLAYMLQQRALPALRAFLRALDGSPTPREQSLRFAVSGLVHASRFLDAARFLEQYERIFGSHPDGWTREIIAARAQG